MEFAILDSANKVVGEFYFSFLATPALHEVHRN
jgi:hypothetical protein